MDWIKYDIDPVTITVAVLLCLVCVLVLTPTLTPAVKKLYGRA
jgi:hypothetical protein